MTLRDSAAIRVALQAGFRYEGQRRGAAPGGGEAAVLARLPGDEPVPARFPDLPPGGLTDGVVTLRLHRPGDAQALWETFCDPESVRWALREATHTFEQFAAVLAEAPAEALLGKAVRCTVSDAASGAVAGDVQVVMMDPFLGRLNLGYSTHPSWRGRGFARRAAGLLAGWASALPEVHRVEASANVHNAASLRVLEQAGFVREGTLHALLPSPLGPRQDCISYWWPDR